MKYYLLIQLLSNSYLCSVILITQFITYPSFYNIDKETFIHHHKKYVDSISLIVAPIMLVELFSLIMIVYLTNDFTYIKCLIFLLCIWLITFIIIVPLHNKLSKRLDHIEIKRLINYNWIRTFLWLSKLIVIIFVSYEKF